MLVCMSVQTIKERICPAKNEVLIKKLQQATTLEKIDNYNLCMLSDNYCFNWVYALSKLVLGVVKIKEKLKFPRHCKHSEAIYCN